MVFFDLDGTVVTERFTVPESAARAIRALRNNGHLAVVNTGRPFTHIEPAVRAIGFDAYVCACGAYLRVGDEVLWNHRPEKEACRAMIGLVRECGLDVAYESTAGLYFDNTKPLTPMLEECRVHYGALGLDTEADIDDEDFVFDKFCVWENDRSDLAAFREKAERYFSVIDREGTLVELPVKGETKALGARRAAGHFGVSWDNCYAVGDSTNDLPMLTAVPHGIAMGGAPDELKARAEFVTTDILDDGIQHALERFGLI